MEFRVGKALSMFGAHVYVWHVWCTRVCMACMVYILDPSMMAQPPTTWVGDPPPATWTKPHLPDPYPPSLPHPYPLEPKPKSDPHPDPDPDPDPDPAAAPWPPCPP